MVEQIINEPSSELLDGVLQILGLTEHPKKEQIKGQLQAQANAFTMHRSIGSKFPTIHQDAERMRKIAKDCIALRRRIHELHPLVYVGLHTSYSEHNNRETSLKNLEEGLIVVKSIAEEFGAAKFANKQADHVLRNAVGGLMLLMECYTGNRATVQKRNSDFEISPELSSPEAKAIGVILRFSQPNLQDTTLVNVITAIRLEGDNYKKRYMDQLMLGGPITAF